MTAETMLTPREAARMLGISYPTIKHWILQGKLVTKPTIGGHHRIALSTLDRFLGPEERSNDRDVSRARFRRVSGRNQIIGKVVSIRIKGIMAEVILAIGRQSVTSIITATAAKELNVKKGDAIAALVKATDVMLERVD